VALSEMLSKVGMPTTAKRLHALCRFLEKLHVIKIEKATKTLFLSGLGENEFIWADTTAMTSPQVSEICEFDCCDLYKQLRADPEFLTDRVVREKVHHQKAVQLFCVLRPYGIDALRLSDSENTHVFSPWGIYIDPCGGQCPGRQVTINNSSSTDVRAAA